MAEPMIAIDIDFDVYKELMARRATQDVAFNDVLRQLLELSSDARLARSHRAMEGWVSKNVTFPEGTEFEATYKGKRYLARVVDSRLTFDGKPVGSLSLAAHRVTSKNINGWRFWRCRFPGDTKWRSAESLRGE